MQFIHLPFLHSMYVKHYMSIGRCEEKRSSGQNSNNSDDDNMRLWNCRANFGSHVNCDYYLFSKVIIIIVFFIILYVYDHGVLRNWEE